MTGRRLIAGALTRISAGSDSGSVTNVWGANAAGNIYHYTAQFGVSARVATSIAIPGFQALGPSALKRIPTGSATNIWAINATDNIYRYTEGGSNPALLRRPPRNAPVHAAIICQQSCGTQSIFGLLTLLGASGVRANSHTPHSPELECSLQAWVRAPDLAPGTIIQGDARLKVTAGCARVESALLGLRFKERSFVKASRSIEATKRQAKERAPIDIFDPERASPASPWVLPAHDSINCSADIAFGEIVKNKDLWLVREEERIMFESTQAIDMGEAPPGSVRDVVQDFAILVPLTNFPPALDYSHPHIAFREGEFVNVEMMYEYFVRVIFTNGTVAEIPAGFTAFHPLYDPPSNDVLRSKTVQLEESLEGSPVDNDPVASYTAQIISKHDRFVFSQGSDDQFVEVAITRTGRARTFVEPLALHLCIDSTISPKWATEYTTNPALQSLHKPNQILRAASADFKKSNSPSTSRCIFASHHTPHPIYVSMPNATSEQIASGEIVTTTSTPVRFLADADPRHATDFETYYHTLSNTLVLSLDVPRTQDEPLNEKDIIDLRATRKKTPVFEADEEAWVPWYNVPEVTLWRGYRTYTGNISISVYPAQDAQPPRQCVRSAAGSGAADLEASKQVILGSSAHEDDLDCALRSPVHYLSEGARAPTFIDDNLALGAKTPAERDALAPLLKPAVSSPPEGEERVHRYYRVPKGHRPLIYVGETWVKKVAHTDEHRVSSPRRDAMPTVLAQMEAMMRHMFDEL